MGMHKKDSREVAAGLRKDPVLTYRNVLGRLLLLSIRKWRRRDAKI
jgi:hypothetical protein